MNLWKDFFFYSPTEKRGVIVLLMLICVAALVGTILHFTINSALLNLSHSPKKSISVSSLL